MDKKCKIVLCGEDGVTEHAQGIVDADRFTSIQLLERNKNVYMYKRWTIENGIFTMFFNECRPPVLITEF